MLIKAMFLVGGGGLIVMSCLRFKRFEEEFLYEFILNFFFLVFGAVACLSQFEIELIKKWFRFLHYHWGRFIFCLVMASMSFASKVD
mmetsp:Transcript_38989/g.28837  ORF Transcript_38989/g.28837 Transcript_38989/m.28837 type:complete len:87 (+) Transcript_38989:62-322(+)